MFRPFSMGDVQSFYAVGKWLQLSRKYRDLEKCSFKCRFFRSHML